MFRLLVLLVVVGTAAPALAQEAQTPRTTGGVFGGRQPSDPNNPDRASQQLSFEIDLLGGYDAQVSGQQISSQFNQAGTIGATSGALLHRWGSSRNYLQSSANGNMTFANVGLRQQTTGASQVQGVLALGRRAGLNVQFDAAYQPTYLFNAFGSPINPPAESVLPDGIAPGSQLNEGFTEERWLATSVSPRLHRNWTPRQVTEIQYTTSRRTLIPRGDNYSTSQAAGFRHDWSYQERAGLFMSYQFDEFRQLGTGDLGIDVDERPFQSHRANVGFRFQKRWPRGRSMTASFGGGATRSQPRDTATSGNAFIVPSMTFGLQTQLSSWWAWSIDGSRNVTILEGLSPQPFISEMVSLTMRGRLGSFAQLATTAAFSHGAAREGSASEFQTAIGNVDLQFPFSRKFSLATTYSYYQHEIVELSEIEARLPARQRRHSVRVGVRLWLPLFGTF